MSAAPTALIGIGILYVLHFRLGLGFIPTFLIGMAFAALSGAIAKRRFGDK